MFIFIIKKIKILLTILSALNDVTVFHITESAAGSWILYFTFPFVFY